MIGLFISASKGRRFLRERSTLFSSLFDYSIGQETARLRNSAKCRFCILRYVRFDISIIWSVFTSNQEKGSNSYFSDVYRFSFSETVGRSFEMYTHNPVLSATVSFMSVDRIRNSHAWWCSSWIEPERSASNAIGRLELMMTIVFAFFFFSFFLFLFSLFLLSCCTSLDY